MTKRKSHVIQFKSYRNKRLEEIPMLRAALIFFLDNLFKRCTIDYKLNIRVELKNGSVKHADGTKNDGLAWEEEIKGVTWYVINLANDVPFLEMLSTLAHETVHITQFATGRLVINEKDEWIWEGKNHGKAYKGKEIDNQLPWEYDAYSKEVELSRKFVKQFYSNW